MKNAFFLIVLLLVSDSAFSQGNGDWETLFNGKDLKGWKQLNGAAKYEIKDGQIVGTTVSNEPNSFLVTEKDYGDFILELEFKVPEGMNSGIQFRSESKPDYQNGRVHGYQFEIDPSPRAWTGGIYDEATGREWLYTLEYNTEAKKAFKQNEWNKVRVECVGTSLRTFVNGVAAANVVDDVRPRGFIALQVHALQKDEMPGRQIQWRNIRIQTKNLKLSPADDLFVMNFIPNNVSAQEQKNGVVLLWDGKSSAGWRGAYKDKFPDKGWEIKDGTISVVKSAGAESQNGGDVITTNEYGPIDLQFEFRLS